MAGSAVAADVVAPMTVNAEAVESDGWCFSVAPYLWTAGLDGKLAQFGAPTVEIHQTFGDILKKFDIGFMAMAEARKGNFSIFDDVQYVRISTDAATPRGVLAESIDVTSKTFSNLLGAGYTVARSDAGFLDVAVGARVWSVDTDISFCGGLLDGRNVSDGNTWVDGLAGVRGNLNLTPQIYLTGWGLIGAGQADLDWDVAAGLGFRLNKMVSSVLGYRALGVDYSNDNFVFDVIQHGPILGVVARF